MGLCHRFVPVLLTIASLCVCGVGSDARAGDAGRRRPQRQRPEKVAGAVKEVVADARQLVIDVNGEDRTYTLDANITITMRGPILDGVRAGDKANLEVVNGADGAKTVKKLTISRGDAPAKPPKARGGRSGRRGGAKAKKPEKKHEEDPEPNEGLDPAEGQGGDGFEFE